MNFKKAFAVGIAAGLMAGIGSVAQAVTINFTALQPAAGPPPGTTDWSAFVGVNSTAGRFNNVLVTPGSNTVVDQSQIVYFQNTTFDNSFTAPSPKQTDSFVSTGVYFDYTVTINADTRYFRVVGDMSGTMKVDPAQGASSLAKWTPLKFYAGANALTLALIPFINTVDPVTFAPSREISQTIGGVPTSIFIYTQNPLTAPLEPGFPAPTNASINGYILSVPEPGSVGLLLAGAVSGSAFMFRRRRVRVQ